MKNISLGIIREGKTPPDERVPFTPTQLKQIQNDYPNISIKVEPSEIRCFKDEEYIEQGIEVNADLSDCDVLMGVKEVPIANLIPNKTYFFFSHTIKKQPYNADLLRSVIKNNIRLVDYECLAKNGKRVLGFGRYAGIVGCYNAFITYGAKYNLYTIKPANKCADKKEMLSELSKVKYLPNKFPKIALTGNGRVAHGAMEVLDYMGMKKVETNAFLNETFNEPVYCQLRVLDYNKTKDGSEGSTSGFFQFPEKYNGDFMRFAKVSDMYIACHYWKDGSPFIFSRQDAKSNDFNIEVVADISCDIDGPVASTIRPSTIADPMYGYDANSESEVELTQEGSIGVMAVDNLPCELPKDASEDFGAEFIKNVLPSLLNDSENVLLNATIAQNKQLTEKYLYLSDYIG